MSEEGKKESFCPLLFEAGGGAMEEHGFARGLCTRPYDCDTCEYMQHEILQHQPHLVAWICPPCLSTACKTAKQMGMKLTIPGFYSEGYCEYQWCDRPGEETLGLPARYSVLRSLVIGPLYQP